MRPLTDTCPKPLLEAGGKRLIEWQIEALARAGVSDFVINTAHLSPRFAELLGDGSRHGVRIQYSVEGDRAEDALETRGGIVRALPMLGAEDEAFIVVAGDIVTDFDFSRLVAAGARIAAGEIDAHLVLVPNPAFHPRGDMALIDGWIRPQPPTYTYSSLGVFATRLFAGLPDERAKLFPWLYEATLAQRVSGELHDGAWANVGTPAELARLDAEFARRAAEGEAI